jgi:hypothetical protein
MSRRKLRKKDIYAIPVIILFFSLAFLSTSETRYLGIIGLSFLFIIIVIPLVIVFLIKKISRKCQLIGLPKKERNIIEFIEKFKPSKNWGSEEGYQGELQGFLKHEFPNSKVEVQTGSSRPDIIIDKIAIEIKGPTDDNAINSLPAKCIKYSKHYDKLIIVLFRPNYSERNYKDIMEGIKNMFPDVHIIIKDKIY